MASLFAKLSKPPEVTGQPSGGAWRAVLARQETGNFFVTGAPLSASQLSRGCIVQARSVSTSGVVGEYFLISFNLENSNTAVTAGSAVTVSASSKVLDSLGVPKDCKELELVEADSLIGKHMLDQLVVSLKDRYVSKRDLWVFQIRLLGAVLYRGASPPLSQTLQCSQTLVVEMKTNACSAEDKCMFGIVGPQTKIVVLSESAQVLLLVSVSAECWEFHPGTREPNFVRMIQFLRQSLEAAIADGKTHHLLLILTARLAIDVYEKIFDGPIQSIGVSLLVTQLSAFFNQYPSRAGWRDNIFFRSAPVTENEGPSWFLPSRNGGDFGNTLVRDTALCGCKSTCVETVSGFPSRTAEANLMESINLGISHFNKHHLDRKLSVTGLQITVLTCNVGVVMVADKNLLAVCRRRILDSGCGIKLVSVGQKPVIVRPTRVLVKTNACSEVSAIDATWLPINYFTGSFPVGCGGSDELDQLIPLRCPFRPLPTSITTRSRPFPKPFLRAPFARELRTDAQIIDLAILTPRLQRVATEANIKPSDVKQIDNWIVQGTEGVRTMHDLIGIRLSLDMQLVDISGTPMDESGQFFVPPTPATPATPAAIPSQYPPTISSIISTFGSKVHRASMRENHITKVLIKGEDKCLWNLHHLESGNVYVSKATLSLEAALSNENFSTEFPSDTFYKYLMRNSPIDSPKTSPACDIIVCKLCLQNSPGAFSVETRWLGVLPPLPWNILDDLIANQYMQQTLPSSVPHNAFVPPELRGFRWKLRSSIKTALFALIPKDAEFTHASTGSYSLGSDVLEKTSSPLASLQSSITSRFLDWLRKLEKLTSTTLPVSVERKRVTGFGVSRLVRSGRDWFGLHAEEHFQFPKIFLFSIEWILCHSAVVEHTLSEIRRCSLEDGFDLVRLPHAQLFPPPSPSGFADELPFHGRTKIFLPDVLGSNFFPLLLSRAISQLHLLVLFSTKDESSPEGTTKEFLSRKPGWILTSRHGESFVEIQAGSVDWISNYIDSASDMQFLLLRQIVHTSIIDSSQS